MVPVVRRDGLSGHGIFTPFFYRCTLLRDYLLRLYCADDQVLPVRRIACPRLATRERRFPGRWF